MLVRLTNSGGEAARISCVGLKEKRQSLFSSLTSLLFDDAGDDTRTNGLATFTDSETVVVVHGDRSEQFHLEGDSITRHDDFFVSWELNFTGHISSAEVELWFVALGERSVAATFLFLQDVNLGFKLGVWGNATWSSDDRAQSDRAQYHGARDQHCRRRDLRQESYGKLRYR